MLEQGYSLLRVEVLNWGNFHGYQKFDLRSEDALPGMLAPPSASAILGVNGSGKSTLIDALMITLLPFENSLKLGVTNDVESGSSGGRTIRDYVLGKHSATNSQNEKIVSSAYGRNQGCSMVCLQFKHNRSPNKFLSLGRLWWYQNQTVSDTQIAFISYDKANISQLCHDSKTPRTAKDFRQHMKMNQPHVQLFETMQSYFTALSGSLGQISRDDLKILNRAFYVKSISNIDQFIRDNMLIEQDSPHLSRMLENVKNGREIATAINTCETKIAYIRKIVKDLEQLNQLSLQKAEKELKLRVLTLHKDWHELQEFKVDLEKKSAELSALLGQLPGLQHIRKEFEIEQDQIQSQLAHHDLNHQLQNLSLQIEFLEKEVLRLQTNWDDLYAKAKNYGIKISYEKINISDLIQTIDAKNTDYEHRLSILDAESERLRSESFEVERQTKERREEFEHLTKSKTVISKDLYSIKEEAIADLEIPPSSLVFVGELIKVKDSERENRKAIESVLFPISRNILCHPDYLNDFTKWLDARGLKSDVTAKRISIEELDGKNGIDSFTPAGGDKRFSAKQQILSMIELLPESQNPFFRYLWAWLHDTFDYQLVELKEFRTQHGKLVTREGLVKTDTRTMRKLKNNFPSSLGWDNRETIELIARQLQQLNTLHLQLKESLQTAVSSHTEILERKRFCTELSSRICEFSDFTEKKKSLDDLKMKLKLIHSNNPDYLKLKESFEAITIQLKQSQKRESQLEAEASQLEKSIKVISALIPSKEAEIKNSSLYMRLVFEMKSEAMLIEALQAVEIDLQKKKTTRLNFESYLQEEVFKISTQMDKTRNTAASALENYKQTYDDTNMPFLLPENKNLSQFVEEWSQLSDRLQNTELPQAQEKWKKFFDQILVDSVKDTINEIKSKLHEIQNNISSINEVLRLTNFEDLPDEKRYLKIHIQSSHDDRVRKFRKKMTDIEKILGPTVRSQVETQSQQVMEVLVPFVDELQNDTLYRNFVTDVRQHFSFEVHSLSRSKNGEQDQIVEIFSGARRDAKSSAQTTQLAYTLLASCLAYRFKFHDPVAGQETPRLLILDEFGGKFDNEKPREILKLLDQMGFQSVLVSPMSKADLLAESISHLVLVHKVSATQSKVHSYQLTSKRDYEELLKSGLNHEQNFKH